MTEIVDERQRLVARLRQWARVGTEYVTLTAKEAADLIEQDGKRLSRARDALIAARDTAPGQTWTLAFVEEMNAVIDALTSPSEGNKKGDGIHIDPKDDDWGLLGATIENPPAPNDALRSLMARPQPRKATGEVTAERYAALSAEVDRQDREIADLERRIGALSVSPAAAQGWQPIETAPKDGTEIIVWNGHERLIAEWRVPRSGADPYWHSVCGGSLNVLLWMPLAAAPASPAAQEQEKGEQT